VICIARIRAPVYNGRDNSIALVLETEAGVLADLSGLTRVVVDLDGGTTVVDSDTATPGAITWTSQELDAGALVDVLRLKLGGEGLVPASYPDVAVIIYDAGDYTNGLRFETEVELTVHGP
jgi:hypothetical protein